MLIIVSGIVLAILGALGAYQGSAALPLEDWISSPWRYLVVAAIVIAGAALGWLLGATVGRFFRNRLRAIDRAADRRSAAELTVGALGLVVGLVAAALAGVAVAQLPIIGPYLLVPIVLVVAYLFTPRRRAQARRHPAAGRHPLALVGGQRPAAPGGHLARSSTAAWSTWCKTKFLSGAIVVPDFVLDELQRVADSADALKRARGRRGLEIVEQLKSSANGGFSVREGRLPRPGGR